MVAKAQPPIYGYDMKPLGLVLGLTAAALIALGLFLGFRTVYTGDGRDCGSAFKANPYMVSLGTTCDKERSDALPLPLVVLTLGAVAGIGSAAAIRAGQSQREPLDAHSAPSAP